MGQTGGIISQIVELTSDAEQETSFPRASWHRSGLRPFERRSGGARMPVKVKFPDGSEREVPSTLRPGTAQV